MPAQRFRLAVLLVVLGLPLAARAQSDPVPSGPQVEVVLGAAVDLGGDRVYEIVYEDGSDATYRAGQGFTFLGGALVRPSATSPFGLRATVGYKFMETSAENGTIRFNRFPVQGVALFNATPDLFVGAGYTFQAGIAIDGDDIGPDLAFDATGGPTVEAGWRWIAATATWMTYTDEFGETYDANAYGLAARVGFPIR